MTIKETIRRAIEYGVEVKMITGDHLLIAVETAKLLNLGDIHYGSDVVVPDIKTGDGGLFYDCLIIYYYLLLLSSSGFFLLVCCVY